MKLFDFLHVQDARVTPQSSKVHLASFNGTDEPLDVYLRGNFDEWQSWQNNRNFGREHVVALVKLPERDRWLFVGVYAVKGCKEVDADGTYLYDLEPLSACAEFGGRLVVSFARSGRASYLIGENWTEQLTIREVSAEPVKLDAFPGFKMVNISFEDLEYIVRCGTTSWRAALASVAGVYLISDDLTGRLYVGSATGEGGIWSRWCQYVDGHGNNVELKKLVGTEGRDRAKHYRFSVLEIADTHASGEEVLRRESHWKAVLLTRKHGWNAN